MQKYCKIFWETYSFSQIKYEIYFKTQPAMGATFELTRLMANIDDEKFRLCEYYLAYAMLASDHLLQARLSMIFMDTFLVGKHFV